MVFKTSVKIEKKCCSDLLKILKVSLFFLLGIVCIAAAIKYTVGKSTYGYRGLGDIAVFIFFGFVGVTGSAYLYLHEFNYQYLLVAACFGLLSAAVLNINNMRDHVNDKNHNKNTLVVRMGLQKARKYHLFIILFALSCLVAYSTCNYVSWKEFIYLLVSPLLVVDIFKLQTVLPEKMDPFLKRTAIFTFLLALLFFIGKIVS